MIAVLSGGFKALCQRDSANAERGDVEIDGALDLRIARRGEVPYIDSLIGLSQNR
jgi:hypothetical protein